MQQQADKLQEQTEQLRNWNRSLEERVEKQLGEIERIRKLERFLAPQVAQLIASSDGHDALLDSHRREVTVVFCDLRGFTAFTETTEPEEAMNVLREYHAALGELIFRYEGTLDRYAGDGVMILFNAPIQFEDHTKRAVKMAVEMRDADRPLTENWRNRGHSLGFGVGIALGYATLGQVGFEQRLEYAAIGSVTNLASRLCDEAKADQVVVSPPRLRHGRAMGRRRAARRSRAQGLQSSGAGDGDFALARGGRQRGRRCGRRGGTATEGDVDRPCGSRARRFVKAECGSSARSGPHGSPGDAKHRPETALARPSPRGADVAPRVTTSSSYVPSQEARHDE